MLKFKSKEVLKIQTSRQKREKLEKKKLRKPGCHKPTPLRKKYCPRDLVAQGTIANLPSLGNLLLLGFLLTAYCSHGGIQYISGEGVYFTQFAVLTECS